MFDIRGKSSGEGAVRGVRFENLSIAGSGWLRNFESEWTTRINSQPGVDPTGKWANTREGMIRVENGMFVCGVCVVCVVCVSVRVCVYVCAYVRVIANFHVIYLTCTVSSFLLLPQRAT